jgi:hypothetical protein
MNGSPYLQYSRGLSHCSFLVYAFPCMPVSLMHSPSYRQPNVLTQLWWHEILTRVITAFNPLMNTTGLDFSKLGVPLDSLDDHLWYK